MPGFYKGEIIRNLNPTYATSLESDTFQGAQEHPNPIAFFVVTLIPCLKARGFALIWNDSPPMVVLDACHLHCPRAVGLEDE